MQAGWAESARNSELGQFFSFLPHNGRLSWVRISPLPPFRKVREPTAHPPSSRVPAASWQPRLGVSTRLSVVLTRGKVLLRFKKQTKPSPSFESLSGPRIFAAAYKAAPQAGGGGARGAGSGDAILITWRQEGGTRKIGLAHRSSRQGRMRLHQTASPVTRSSSRLLPAPPSAVG